MNNSDSFDDIPDTIEIDGKIHPFDKEGYRKWAIEGGKRILAFIQNGPIEIKAGEIVIMICDPGEFITANPADGTTINIKEAGLKIRKGLVGIAGTYYHPHTIGAVNSEHVIESWDWLFSKNNFAKKEFEEFLEAMSILRMIISGKNEVAIQHIMGLAVDLKFLSDNKIDVEQKINELMSKIKGNWRKFNRLLNEGKEVYAEMHMRDMALTISDMQAESALARIAYQLKMQVEMKKNPDLIIDNVRVEVKNDRHDETNSERFESKIDKGLEQGGELVSIFTDLKKKSHKNKKITWYASESISVALPVAIELCKKGRKCVLLFTGSNKGFFGRVGLLR